VLGGADPYSSSKACTELVVDAYRKSFFSGPDSPLLATVRAGNVIGGGDWGKDRLIPDIARATAVGSPTLIRNPHSVRPWQHVLEPLCGYLKIGARLLARDHTFAGPWNFGPRDTVNVATLAQHVKRAWGSNGPEFEFGDSKDAPHEAKVLRLDSTKAHVQLGWRPQLDVRQAIDMTVEWYRAHAKGTADLRVLTERQIATYEKLSGMASESAGEKDQYRQCV
jgi:CDP-glucose 4,6-dehydratase